MPSNTTTIPHPRRLLTLSPPHTPLLPFLHRLTRSSPPSPDPSTGSLAGLTHEWLLRTPYYTAQIPIWIDEIADPAAWKQDFLRPEAREVVEVVGGWVYGFAVAAGQAGGKEEEMMKEEVGRTMKAVREVVESHLGFEGAQEVVLLAVALPASPSLLPSLAEAGEPTALTTTTTRTQKEMGSRSGSRSGSGGARTQGLFTPSAAADWEDLALEHGFEFIDATRTGRNEFGERTGLERVREALEANDWAGGGDGVGRAGGGSGEAGGVDGDDLDGFLEEFDPDVDGVLGAREEAEMTAELFGLKAALMREEEEEGEGAGAGVEDADAEKEGRAPAGGRAGGLEEVGEGEGKTQAGQVEDLERMMATLLAVREQSAGLPEAERRRVAARAVRGVMGGGGG